MKKIVKIPLVLIIFIMLLIVVPTITIKSNASTTGIVKEVTVNVRKEASIESKVIAFVTQDDKVKVLEKSGDWYKIKFDKKEGYVYCDFIKIENEDKLVTNEKLKSENEEVTTDAEIGRIILKGAVVRIAPNIVSDIVYNVEKNTDFELLEQINGWNYININNVRGWVREEFISDITNKPEYEEKDNQEKTSEEVVEQEQKAYTKYDEVNLREEPSATSKALKKLKLNTEVTIIKQVDTVWNKVKVDGIVGYISKDLLSGKKQEKTTSRDGASVNRSQVEEMKTETETKTEVRVEEKKDTQTPDKKNNNTTNNTESIKKTVTGNDVVEFAKKYLGYDYVYGGSSPKTGFDCSGFTSYIYKQFGYTLSKSSSGQANEGTKVSKEDLKPGDLIIYKNRALTAIGHVGIYIGNNKMIHASEPGVGVIITDIDSKAYKYSERFVMGRRIIK